MTMAGYKGWTPDAPGQQNPHAYDRIGPNYQKFGEQPGWVYYPPTDSYYTDPNYATDYATQHGYGPKKPPGLTQAVLPIAAAGGALALGQGIGKDPAGFFGGIASIPGKIGSALGGGSQAAPIAQTIATNAAGPAAQAAAASAPGLIGLGSGGASSAAAAAEAASAAEMGGAASSAGLAGLSESPGLFSLSGFGGAGNVLLPAAGAMGAFDVLSNNFGNHNLGLARSGIEGAASGAALGSYFGIPGAVVGGGLGGLIGLGSSLFGDTDTWKMEGDRLRDSGAPQAMIDALPTRGRSVDELVKIAQQTGDAADVKFAQSRDLNDLKGHGQSITGYAAFGEHDPNWWGKSMEEKTRVANALLDAGAVNEHNGTIDVDWDKAGPGLMGLAPTAPSNNGSPGRRPRKR